MAAERDITGEDIRLMETKLKIVGIEITNPAKMVVFLFLYTTRETGPKDVNKIQKALYKTLGNRGFHLSPVLASWVEKNLLSMEKGKYTLTESGIELASALNRFFRRIKEYERSRKKLQAQSASFFYSIFAIYLTICINIKFTI